MTILKPTKSIRAIFFLTADIFISFFSLYLSFYLRFNFDIGDEFFAGLYKSFIILSILKIFFLFIFKIYFVAWRFFSLIDAKKIFKAHLLTYLIFFTLFNFFSDFFNPFPRSVIFIDFAISFIFIGVLRISKRLIAENIRTDLKPALIIGANTRTENIIKSYLNGEIEYQPIVIFDENENLFETYMLNLKIERLKNLPEIVKRKGIHSAIITTEYSPSKLDNIFNLLKKNGVAEIKKAIYFEENKKLEDISIEDLLARKPKDLDTELIKNFIKGKTLLITGAGGSIGSEIVRQCSTFGAEKLILVDNSEFNLYRVYEEFPHAIIRLISVTDKDTLDKVFTTHKPSIVIHAAAYKHVHICEENVDECIVNNILGSINVIDLSIKHSVDKLLIISTDKAVRPTSVMGASKRVVEIYAQSIDSRKTVISSVRFGNVLDSSGSVIPKFKEQILKGGPVTVTHPEITRFFMLIPEACKLVLQQLQWQRVGRYSYLIWVNR